VKEKGFVFVRARAHSHRAAQMIEFASDSLFHRFVFSFFLLFFFFFFLNGMRQWLLTCFNFPTFLIQVHYKRPGRLTPLGESLKRERAPDISEDGSGGGYGSGMMGMGGNMGMFGGGFSGMMGGGDDLEAMLSRGGSIPMPPRPPPKPRPDPEITVLLESMGFGANAAQRAALSVNNKGVTEAQEWAFQHMTDANFNEPIGPNEDLRGQATSAAAGAAGAAASAVSGDAAASAAATAATPPPPPVIDEACVAQLEAMGFSANGARRASAATRGNSEAALEWVFAHMEDADFNEPFPSPTVPPPLEVPGASSSSSSSSTSEAVAAGGADTEVDTEVVAGTAEAEAASAQAAEEGDDQELAMPDAPGALTRITSVKRDAEGAPKPPSPPDLTVASVQMNLPSAPVPDAAAPASVTSAPAAAAAAASAAPPASSTSAAAVPGQLVFDFSQLLRTTSPPEATAPTAPTTTTAAAALPPPPMAPTAEATGAAGAGAAGPSVGLPNGLDIAAIMAAVTQSSSNATATGQSNNAVAPVSAAGAPSTTAGPGVSTAPAAPAAAAAPPPAPPAPVPQVLSVVNEEDTASLLLEMAVAMDEESGANRQLGAAFLYEVSGSEIRNEIPTPIRIYNHCLVVRLCFFSSFLRILIGLPCYVCLSMYTL